MYTVVRFIAGLMTVVFAYAAYLQLNDPDPIQWVAMYAAAAGLSALFAAKHPAPESFHGSFAGVAFLWAFYLSSLVYGSGYVTPMFPEGQMTGNLLVDTEEGREMGGLLIMGGTMVLYVITQLAERARRVPRRRR